MPRNKNQKPAEPTNTQSSQANSSTSQSQKKNIPALFFLPNGQIAPNTVDEVKTKLRTSGNSQIYLVVKSRGGDAYSAVRIIKHMRTKYKTLLGVIPEYAYSAATLMQLGTNKILVSPGKDTWAQ